MDFNNQGGITGILVVNFYEDIFTGKSIFQ